MLNNGLKWLTLLNNSFKNIYIILSVCCGHEVRVGSTHRGEVLTAPAILNACCVSVLLYGLMHAFPFSHSLAVLL